MEYNNSSKLSNDEEINSYKLLYRNKREYATGHGCAVGWSSNDNGAVKELYTETMPSFEVPYNKVDRKIRR